MTYFVVGGFGCTAILVRSLRVRDLGGLGLMLLRLLVWAMNHRVGQVILVLAIIALMIVIESVGLAGWE